MMFNFVDTCIFFDRKGHPIDLNEYCELLDRGMEYSRVGHSYIKHIQVSTVWLGLDSSLGYGPPIIFETMLFPTRKRYPVARHMWNLFEMQWRYSTERMAQENHIRICNILRSPDGIRRLWEKSSLEYL